MKRVSLQDMSVDALVARFAELGEKQYRAELLDDHPAFNRHYDEIDRVRNEL